MRATLENEVEATIGARIVQYADKCKDRLYVSMIELEGPKGIFGVFDEDDGAGYFCIYDANEGAVLSQVCLYESAPSPPISDGDVRLMWSSDQVKCGIVIWGRMRGVLEFGTGKEVCLKISGRESPAITDPDVLNGFADYLDSDEFIRARQRYWKERVREQYPGAPPPETNFIVYEHGFDKTFGVFEDDGECGYLYLYSSLERTIARFLHVYDRSEELDVLKDDVAVLWSEDRGKCGVKIWGKMRGIIDLVKDTEGRVWLESRRTPGIGDKQWLAGF
jgi:hypothetical protein